MEFLNINIREATKEDLPSVLEIEKEAFPLPWSYEDFLNEIENNEFSNFWVLELEQKSINLKGIYGYSIYWSTFNSGTICKIAVHSYLRRRQLGSALMDEIINDCYAKKISTLTLEVRVSNKNAIAFYIKHGFKILLTKKNYYSDGEDAYYMMQEIK